MDTVKATISIGETSVQLEGPRDFVEKYLAHYQAIIEKEHASISTSHKATKETEAEKSTPKRTKTVRPKAGPASGEKISELITQGYFREQRTREEVQTKLLEKGLRYDSSIISASLNNLFKGGKIEKTGVGRNAKYYSNV